MELVMIENMSAGRRFFIFADFSVESGVTLPQNSYKPSRSVQRLAVDINRFRSHTGIVDYRIINSGY